MGVRTQKTDTSGTIQRVAPSDFVSGSPKEPPSLEALSGVPDMGRTWPPTGVACPSYAQPQPDLNHSVPTPSFFFLSPAIRTIAATLVAAALTHACLSPLPPVFDLV